MGFLQNPNAPALTVILHAIAFLCCCKCTLGEIGTSVDWRAVADEAYACDKTKKPAFMPTANAVLSGLCPHGYFGDHGRLREMVLKIEKKKEFNIAIMGGSVPKVGKYPYPFVLQDFLRPYFPFNVNVFNFANPGAPSVTQAPKFPYIRENISSDHIDLIIMDIAANDAPTHPWLQRERRDSKRRNVEAEGREEMELLLNHLKEPTALLYFETPTKTQRKPPLVEAPENMSWGLKPGYGYNNLLELKQKTCAIQNIASNLHWVPLLSLHTPVYSYMDMACALKIPDQEIWGNDIHPGEKVHLFAGTALGLGILELLDMAASNSSRAMACPTATPDQVNAWDRFVQKEPPVELMARECSYKSATTLSTITSFEPVWHGPAWGYYEDVKGKLGWISNSKYANDQATNSSKDWDIHFNISFSQNSKFHIRMVLLVSYVHEMGTLDCCLDCDDNNFVREFSFNTLIREKFSIGEEFSFTKNAPTTNSDLLAGESRSRGHILKCRGQRNRKLKILSIVGC